MAYTGIDWKEFSKHRHDPEAVKALGEAITDYFRKPLEKKTAQIVTLAEALKNLTGQKFQLADPNLAGTTPVISVYSAGPEEDFGFERLYDFVDMRDSSSPDFEILDVTNAINFVQRKPGEPIKIQKVTSGTQKVSYISWAGGLGFADEYFRFNKYYLLDDIVATVRRKYYDTMAQHHYSLFEALGSGINEAFQTDDVTTINNACANILKNVNSKGYGVGENPIFKLLCGVGLKARLAKAVAAAFTNPNNNNNQIVYRVDEIIATTKLPDTHYYVVLPKIKLKRGVWDDLNAESQRDALLRVENMTWEGKYNAAIGDSDQVRRCALA